MRRLDNFEDGSSSEVSAPREAHEKKDFETSEQDYNDKFDNIFNSGKETQKENADLSKTEDLKVDEKSVKEEDNLENQKDDFDKKAETSESDKSHRSLKDKFQGALDGFAKGVAIFSAASNIINGAEEAVLKPNNVDYVDPDMYSTVSTQYPEGAAEGTDNIEIKLKNPEKEPTDFDKDGEYEFEDALIDIGETIENIGSGEDSAILTLEEWMDKAREENDGPIENETEGN